MSMNVSLKKSQRSNSKNSTDGVIIRVNRRGGLYVEDTKALLNSPRVKELIEKIAKIKTANNCTSV